MPQASEEGKSSYRGRSHRSRGDMGERSAEAVVVGSNEPRTENVEDSQAGEGPNIRMFQMQQGGLVQPCYKRNMANEVNKKE